MTEEVKEAVGEETYSGFKEALSGALSQATGREDLEVAEEEPEEEIVEQEVSEDDVEDAPKEEEVSGEKEAVNAIEDEFKLIPKEWSEKERTSFQSALDNPELKDAAETFIGRYENLKKDYYRKATETAEMRRSVSEWDEVFDESAKGALQARGINEREYVQRLLNVERQLIQNPVDTFKKLAQAYRVDIKQLVDNNTDDDGIIDYDKTISEMKQELDSLKNKELQTKTQSAADAEAGIAKQIKDFEFAIDETGELKYPDFKEVRDEMAILINKGKATTLEDAYELCPTIKEKRLHERSELDSKKQIQEEKRKVAKAKKAAKGVTNKKVAAPAREVKRSLEDRLKEKFAESRAG